MTEAEKLMKRATRAAKSVKGGTDLLNRLKQEDAIDLMIEGVEEEVPSVSKIASIVVEEVGSVAAARLPTIKTLVGLCVRAILAQEGYVKSERGVRTDPKSDTDRIFSTGTVYLKAEPEKDEEDEGADELVDLIVTVSKKLLSGAARQRVVERLEATLN